MTSLVSNRIKARLLLSSSGYIPCGENDLYEVWAKILPGIGCQVVRLSSYDVSSDDYIVKTKLGEDRYDLDSLTLEQFKSYLL